MDKRLVVVMPVHNEEAYLASCLDTFVRQTRPPDLLLLVDDGSTDRSPEVAGTYADRHLWIRLLRKSGSGAHAPGAKVVRCFQYGQETLEEPFDYIGKFDADILLPEDYFEKVLQAFAEDSSLGICSGLLYVGSGDRWVYEPIADTSHVRGPVKCYRSECFKAIGGLRESIGWDTADTLLARFHGFGVKTLPELRVKHLRPTARAYGAQNHQKQGEALYLLRYGCILGTLASLKMAWKRRSLTAPAEHLRGALHARKTGKARLLNPKEGRFARKWRWRQIFRKLRGNTP